MHRLNTMAPELVSKINDASAVKQQALTAAACFFAVSLLTEVDKQVLAEARDLLVHGKAAPAAFLEQLEQLAWSYDEKYLALQDRNDYLPYFIHARSLSALHLALKDNSANATLDAIYEVAHASDDKKNSFLSFIQSLLD